MKVVAAEEVAAVKAAMAAKVGTAAWAAANGS
jgi:hypothetical protein